MEDLTEKELQILYGEMATKRKTPLVTYVLFFLLGGFGVHKFYLGRGGLGLLYMFLTGASIFLFWFGFLMAVVAGKDVGAAPGFSVIALSWFFWITLGICGLIDIFTIPKQTDAANDQMKSRIAASLINARPRVIQPLQKQEADFNPIEPIGESITPPRKE